MYKKTVESLKERVYTKQSMATYASYARGAPLSFAPGASLYTTGVPTLSYAAGVPFAAQGAVAAPAAVGPAGISEAEGQAPEGTPLSAALCARLGVPNGTIWGLPSGQRRDDAPAPEGTPGKAPASSATPVSPMQKSMQI